MTRRQQLTLRYAGYGVIILLVVSGLNFWQVIRPPQIIGTSQPANFALPEPQTVTIEATDGIDLAAWYFAAPKPRGVIVFLHGYPAEKSDMLFLASHLWPDYSLLLKDFRYFGDSGGRVATLGIKEPADIIRTVDWLADRDYVNIGLAGFSYGGAQAILAAAKDDRIKAVASYSAYADLRQLGHETIPLGRWLGQPIVYLMEVWAWLLWQDTPTRPTPMAAIAKLDIPIWLAHDQLDDQINFRHGRQLAQAGNHNPKLKTYFFNQGRHGALPWPEFVDRLKDFFDQAW